MCQKNVEIIEYLKKNQKASRFEHTLRVAEQAKKMLIGQHDEALIAKAVQAALFHDMARNLNSADIDRYIDELKLDERYRNNINLSHGKIGAFLARRDFDIEDEDVLNAVSYHTTGRRGMSMLEKVIFLADAIEPGRRYEWVDYVRQQSEISIEHGCLASLSGTIDFVNSKGEFLDNDTLEAFDDISNKL